VSKKRFGTRFSNRSKICRSRSHPEHSSDWATSAHSLVLQLLLEGHDDRNRKHNGSITDNQLSHRKALECSTVPQTPVDFLHYKSLR